MRFRICMHSQRKRTIMVLLVLVFVNRPLLLLFSSKTAIHFNTLIALHILMIKYEMIVFGMCQGQRIIYSFCNAICHCISWIEKWIFCGFYEFLTLHGEQWLNVIYVCVRKPNVSNDLYLQTTKKHQMTAFVVEPCNRVKCICLFRRKQNQRKNTCIG